MDSLGDRMKTNYEDVFRYKLVKRMPVIIRVDGKAFHTLTRGLDKPFDESFRQAMSAVGKYLCKNIQNTKIAYIQSDEISLLLNDYTKLTTQQWVDGNVQKITSISASVAGVIFSEEFKRGFFDSRVFNIPKEEVCNYFIWRQQDATRNSIQGLGQANFSQKQLNKLSCCEIQDKLMVEKGINWNNIPTRNRRGFCIVKNTEWEEDCEIPLFTQDREYIEQYI